ncbi:hypothetical protein GS399_13370 [Pedobacter sp. HMF7647]|uniref:Ferric uptake regulator family protein n=1 Tax=Hufsiella arboris TaxID=2695275 RepID=A0A7K1YBJ3_9SPHI|nr:transcriptional repressor [Hufsiella arboris]MXV51967.1 hypothetical protein [Hufsiella arboris]
MTYHKYQFRGDDRRILNKQQQDRQIDQVIINILFNFKEEVTAEKLFLEIRNNGFPMSITTVYKRLKALSTVALVTKIKVSNKESVYRLATAAANEIIEADTPVK